MHHVINRFKKPLAISVGTKIFLLIFSYFAFQIFSHQSISSFGQFLEIWNRWDALHYIHLAEYGYASIPLTGNREDVFIVFLPFFPILVKIFSLFTGGNFMTAAMSVSFVFSILASLLLYEICKLDFGEKIALKAVLFLNIFPTSYFMLSAYTESTFLTLSLAFYLAVRKNLFPFPILFGFLAGLTRLNAILLFTLTIGLKKATSLLYTFSIVTGLLIYLLINQALFESPFYFLNILHNHWYKSFSYPWVGIKNSIFYAIHQDTLESFIVFFQEPVYLILLLILGLFVFLKVNKSWGVYLITSFLLFSSTSFILSSPRYLLVLFPIYIAMAILAENKVLLILFKICSIAFLLFFTTLFVSGHWAF